MAAWANRRGALALAVRTAAADLRGLSGFRFPPVESDDAARRLRAQGIVAIPDFWSSERCDQVRRRLEAVITEAQGIESRVRVGGGTVRHRLTCGSEVDYRYSHDGRAAYDSGMLDIWHVDRCLPELAELREEPRIRATIDAAAGRRLTPRNLNAYYNKGVTNPRGFHMDSAGPQYKSFIYLTDVNAESDGAYTYVTGSHGLSVRRYANFVWNLIAGYPAGDMRLFLPEDRIAVQLARRGTLILSDQRGFHRGLPQARDRERLHLTLNVGP